MMKILLNKNIFSRYMFVAIALLIAIGSLVVSHILVSDLSKEEQNKIKIWAEATKEMINAEDKTNLNLISLILQSNTTIPVILHDEKTDYYTSANIDTKGKEEQEYLKKKVQTFKNTHKPLLIELDDYQQQVYYDDSYTLKRLQIFPYIQLGVMGVFVLASILALLSTKRREQDRVWVGLSKETAHQLGTPLSSLIAWIEYLKLKEVDESITEDMGKDISRLQMITDRFSKIGSTPTLERRDIVEVTEQAIAYLEKRISKKVELKINLPTHAIHCNVSEQLYAWVIENITKNAVDAMSGVGTIVYEMTENTDTITLDITDIGKGIAKKNFKAIFRPGHTSKSRGWGLGLSLAKRIIETYHRGWIYVLRSEIDVGSTFRIELRKSER